MKTNSCVIDDRQYINQQQQEQYYNFNQAYVVPSLYIQLPQAGWTATVTEEATDKEILRCLEKSGHFDFLKNPEEDIYGISDGEPI